MLTCVYHPIDSCRYVEEDEGAKLKASGVWFDCPRKSKNYREKVEAEIRLESEDKPRDKPKLKGKGNERR